jgi:hypothetical protein
LFSFIQITSDYRFGIPIAWDYRHLIGEKDGDGKTGLQLLSCNPSSAFKQEPEDGFVKFWCGEKGVQERQEVLLSIRTLYQMEGVQETLLILALKSGCVEIVEEILKLY